MLSQALARGDRQAINYFVAQKYVEAFGKFATAPNQKVIFLPLEATALLGSLGGIGEIAREALRPAQRRRQRRGAPLMPVLEPIQFWHWWALAGALVIVEVFAPGIMFLWLGVAAGLVGALLLLWPGLALKVQILMFAALSVASVLAWRRYQKAHPMVTDEPHLNRRGAGCVGQRAALAAPIVNGRGRIRLGDSSWPAVGPDLPAGTTVEVTGVAGTLLQVQPLRTGCARARRRPRSRGTAGPEPGLRRTDPPRGLAGCGRPRLTAPAAGLRSRGASPRGEIGRRGRLKICWPQGRAGSSPAGGTKPMSGAGMGGDRSASLAGRRDARLPLRRRHRCRSITQLRRCSDLAGRRAARPRSPPRVRGDLGPGRAAGAPARARQRPARRADAPLPRDLRARHSRAAGRSCT